MAVTSFRHTIALSALAAALFVSQSALAADPAESWVDADTNTGVLWAGVAGQENVIAGYAGGIWALNGDLDAAGFLLKAQVLFVDYDFATTVAPGTGNGDVSRGNVSIGYQWVDEGYVASIFAGLDLQEHDITPAAASTLDDEAGLIVSARVATRGGAMYPMSIVGNYSTANDTYWVRARAGYKMNNFEIGPEVAALGDQDDDAFRVGAYAKIEMGDIILELNGGYHDGDDTVGTASVGESAYGGVTLIYVY